MTHTVPPPTDAATPPTPNVRWKVACINWGHPTAPHAATYRLRDGEMQAERYWPTWAEAVAYVQDASTRPIWTDLWGIDPDFPIAHEHDAAGCLDCECSATPWSSIAPCTCGEASA